MYLHGRGERGKSLGARQALHPGADKMSNEKWQVTSHFLEPSFKETGADNSNAKEVNQVEQKVGLAEEGSFPGTEVEQESVGTLEARSG